MSLDGRPPWRGAAGVCRCCLAEGCFKLLSEEYQWLGGREVYQDMLAECFGLTLADAPDRQPRGSRRLICEVCITRLRDASNFKKQVVSCEGQLLRRVGGGDSDAALTFPKPEELKVEAVKKESEDEECAVDFLNEQVDNDGDDSDPPAKSGTKVEEGQSDSDAPLSGVSKRKTLKLKAVKRTKPSAQRDSAKKAKPSAQAQETKKSKGAQQRLKPSSSKTPADSTGKGPNVVQVARVTSQSNQDRPKRAQGSPAAARNTAAGFVINRVPSVRSAPLRIRTKLAPNNISALLTKKREKTNMIAVLKYSNATPFKRKNTGVFKCFYCGVTLDNGVELKRHTADNHAFDESKIFTSIDADNHIVNAEISDLSCNICYAQTPGLHALKTHLAQHTKSVYPEVGDRIMPFRLCNTNTFNCEFCGEIYHVFVKLVSHLNSHFENYICDTCGASFATKKRIRNHKMIHATGRYPCSVCSKVFTTLQNLKGHVSQVHEGVLRHKCLHCPTRFKEHYQRKLHMIKEHGVERVVFGCEFCEKKYVSKRDAERHTKSRH